MMKLIGWGLVIYLIVFVALMVYSQKAGAVFAAVCAGIGLVFAVNLDKFRK